MARIYTIQEIRDVANTMINRLLTLGTRKETATVRSRRVSWSNHQEQWSVHGGPTVKKGEVVTLDANEILLPFAMVKAIDEASFGFYEHPLFFNSFEAGERLNQDEMKLREKRFRVLLSVVKQGKE